ncbi:MAG: hypothetical protein GY696_32020 [Gammaproteobacteria bacterium]|nr:hypothetical protein [Gammaproteobacteria bacterium]
MAIVGDIEHGMEISSRGGTTGEFGAMLETSVVVVAEDIGRGKPLSFPQDSTSQACIQAPMSICTSTFVAELRFP